MDPVGMRHSALSVDRHHRAADKRSKCLIDFSKYKSVNTEETTYFQDKVGNCKDTQTIF